MAAAALWLLDRDPDATIATYAVPASSGAHDAIGIALQRDGRLALTIRERGGAVQRWEENTDAPHDQE